MLTFCVIYFYIKNYYVGRLSTSHCLRSYIHLIIHSILTVRLRATYTMTSKTGRMPEASCELLELPETFSFLFREPAQKTQ